jgi:hypothetical protein
MSSSSKNRVIRARLLGNIGVYNIFALGVAVRRDIRGKKRKEWMNSYLAQPVIH